MQPKLWILFEFIDLKPQQNQIPKLECQPILFDFFVLIPTKNRVY